MIHTILWQRQDLPGHDFAQLEAQDGGWALAGTAVFVHDAASCTLDYRIRCGADWRTTAARIAGHVGSREVALDVSVSEDGQWMLNGVDCPEVAGCVDIDLGFSPSTNLLPIRRLSLEVGASSEVRAAWLPFPALAFEPLLQRYRRLDARSYRYESGGGIFTRTLEVSEVGFVTSYPGFWQIEAAARP